MPVKTQVLLEATANYGERFYFQLFSISGDYVRVVRARNIQTWEHVGMFPKRAHEMQKSEQQEKRKPKYITVYT